MRRFACILDDSERPSLPTHPLDAHVMSLACVTSADAAGKASSGEPLLLAVDLEDFESPPIPARCWRLEHRYDNPPTLHDWKLKLDTKTYWVHTGDVVSPRLSWAIGRVYRAFQVGAFRGDHTQLLSWLSFVGAHATTVYCLTHSHPHRRRLRRRVQGDGERASKLLGALFLSAAPGSDRVTDMASLTPSTIPERCFGAFGSMLDFMYSGNVELRCVCAIFYGKGTVRYA
jgi:hypothetical protein